MGESDNESLDILAKDRVALLQVCRTVGDKFKLCSDIAIISVSSSLESAMKFFQFWDRSEDEIPLTFWNKILKWLGGLSGINEIAVREERS